MEAGKSIVLIAQRSAAKDEPAPEDLYTIGTVANLWTAAGQGDHIVRYYADDEYDDNESEVSSAVEYSDSELEDEEEDSDMDDFIVEDKSESSDDDNGGPEPGTRAPAKRAPVAPVRKSAARPKK